MNQANNLDAFQIYPEDNVAVALKPLKEGETVTVGGKAVLITDFIPAAHKFALSNITAGEPVIKYANRIGIAVKSITTGQWVHDHNIRTCSHIRREYQYHKSENAVMADLASTETFPGYLRKDGSAGIRNHLALIPTVFCSNGPLQKIASLAAAKYSLTDNFDGVLPLTHPYGCSQTGKDLETTGKIIAGMIKNANFGGVLVVSLGCEINDLVQLKKQLDEYDSERIRFLILQESEDEFEEGLALCEELYEVMKADQRVPVPFSKLHVALNCGGSDSFSGITANKMAGVLAERLVVNGATVSMTEVPEMFGAEHLLMNRAVNEGIFERTVDLIRNYTAYFERYGEKVSDNPTQGNKAGGLSTIEEKSLGCIQKGGSCAVTEVLEYGDRASKNGLILVSGPGNDLAGVTGQIAAGAVLTIFTTGRGTPCGFAGPTYRLSSNSELASKKSGWIDFDAGELLRTASQEEENRLNQNLYDHVLQTIRGEYQTKNEKNGYYQMGILRDGVTL